MQAVLKSSVLTLYCCRIPDEVDAMLNESKRPQSEGPAAKRIKKEETSVKQEPPTGNSKSK